MPEIDGPVLVILVLIATGIWAVDKAKEPVKHVGKAICHVVTLGHKCDNPKQPKP